MLLTKPTKRNNIMGLRDKKLATTASASTQPAAQPAEKPTQTATAATTLPPEDDVVPTAGAAIATAAAASAEPDWVAEDDALPIAGGDDHDDSDLISSNAGVFDATHELNGSDGGALIEHDNAAAKPPAVRAENAGTVAVHSHQQGGFLAAQQELEEQGYATDVSFGTFPQFVLNNLGLFECKDWSDRPLNELTALHVIVVQVRRKWLYREKKDKNARVRYSYDLIPYPKNPDASDASGNPISAFIALLEGEGAEWESKLYYEALAVVTGGEGNGWQEHLEEMILISMSPTSKGKWSGYTIQTKFMKKLMPHQIVTRISRGPMMTVKDQNFYPLAFKYLGKGDLSSFAAADGVEITGDVE